MQNSAASGIGVKKVKDLLYDTGYDLKNELGTKVK